MTSAPVVFLDTETTGLTLDDDIWEIAAIRREPTGETTTLHLFVEHDPAKRAAMPDRFRTDLLSRYTPDTAVSPEFAALQVCDITDGAHVVGAVPNFDTERLALLLRRHGHEPRWHYHLICVENLAVGYLAAAGMYVSLPWRSDDLARALGVTISEEERHTALGDARWAMRTYDAVMGAQQP